MSDLAALPGDTPCYVEGYGVALLKEIRGTEDDPAVDALHEATYQMWEDIATRNLCRKPWEPGATVSEIKAFHVSRFLSAQTQRAST